MALDRWRRNRGVRLVATRHVRTNEASGSVRGTVAGSLGLAGSAVERPRAGDLRWLRFSAPGTAAPRWRRHHVRAIAFGLIQDGNAEWLQVSRDAGWSRRGRCERRLDLVGRTDAARLRGRH